MFRQTDSAASTPAPGTTTGSGGDTDIREQAEEEHRPEDGFRTATARDPTHEKYPRCCRGRILSNPSPPDGDAPASPAASPDRDRWHRECPRASRMMRVLSAPRGDAA